MVCKACGMDSKTAETCSWCGASLNPLPETSPAVKPKRAEPVESEQALDSLPNAMETTVPDADAEDLSSSLHARAALDAYPTLEAQRAPTIAPSAPAKDTSSPLHVHSARKMAPPAPPPSNRAHKPAPGAAPPPSKRAGAPSFPPSSPAVPAANLAASTLLPENTPANTAHIPHPPAASLQEMADAMVVPLTGNTAEAAEAGAATSTFSAVPPARPLSAPMLAEIVQAEPTIGTGTVPSKAASLPPSDPSIAPSVVTARNKRAAVEAVMADAGPSASTLLGRYLGVFTVIALAMTALAYFLPKFYIVPMVIAMFVAALLLPVMRVTPWVEEDAEDLAIFIGLMLLFGPLVALIIYGVIAAFRQSFNASIMGCLAVVALLRILAEVASGGVGNAGQLFALTSPFAGLQQIGKEIIYMLLRNWSGFVALAGWYAASSFHKEDE